MNKNVKKPILLWSVMLLGLGLSAAFAQIHVKSDLSNAIQNIQKVYFSPEGIQDPNPAKNILVEMDGGGASYSWEGACRNRKCEEYP